MDSKFFLSLLVAVFSLAIVLIGIPSQIAKNYQEKSSGQPLATILILIGFYISQIAFFIVTESYIPLISFIIGLILWCVTLGQYFLYRKK